MAMTRLRIDLAYDGGGFYGWAKQPNLRTVQGTIEDALHKVLRVPTDDAAEPLRLTVAGRTDTGVHASHQVAHLDVSDEVLNRCVGHMTIPVTEALTRRLKAVLPSDIVIHGIAVAPVGFDAVFSALERTYVYRVADRSSEVDPRLRGCVLTVDEALDLELMNRAASLTIGLHDFGSFATPNPGGTTIREVKTAYWRRVPITPLVPDEMASHEAYRTPSLESGFGSVHDCGGRLCPQYGALLVGSCIKVGSGRKSLEWFAGKMAEPVREGSSGPIAPQGLTLEHIAYPADDQLAARAEAIRAVRTL